MTKIDTLQSSTGSGSEEIGLELCFSLEEELASWAEVVNFCARAHAHTGRKSTVAGKKFCPCRGVNLIKAISW